MTTSVEDLVRRKATDRFGNPNDVAHVLGLARQESNFDPSAYNALGDAYGVFQFAGDMRRASGMDTHSGVDKQVDAGLDYLAQLYKKHGGNWTDIYAEHYMGAPRFNRAKRGESDAEVRSFYGSHLPRVEKFARDYGFQGVGGGSSSTTGNQPPTERPGALGSLASGRNAGLASEVAGIVNQLNTAMRTTFGPKATEPAEYGGLYKMLAPELGSGGAAAALSILPPLKEVQGARPIVEALGKRLLRNAPNARRLRGADDILTVLDNWMFEHMPKAWRDQFGKIRTVRSANHVHPAPHPGWEMGFVDRETGDFLTREEGGLAVTEALRLADAPKEVIDHSLERLLAPREGMNAPASDVPISELYNMFSDKYWKLHR